MSLFEASRSSSSAAGEVRDVDMLALLSSKYLDVKSKKKHAREPQKPKSARSVKKQKRETPHSHCKVNKELEWVSKDSPHVKGTTLVEHVPYSSIHGDATVEMNALIQELIDCKVVDERTKKCCLGQEYFDILRFTGQVPGEWSVTVAPALQVVSVRIFNKRNPRWDKFSIYGDITITDEKNNHFYIYKCQSNTADMVSPEYNYLYLDRSCMAPFLTGKVHFRLTTKDASGMVHRLPSFCEVIDLEKSIEDKGGVFDLNCDGSYGYFVQIRFTKIPSAGICKVIMFLSHTTSDPSIEDEKEDVSTYGVYGTIKVNNIVSFDVDKNDPDEVVCGKANVLGQSRTVFALPVYSALDVNVELYRDDRLVYGDTVKIYPTLHDGSDRRTYTYKFPSPQDKRLCFGMDVMWPRPEKFFGCPLWSEELDVQWNPEIAPIKQKYEPVGRIETSLSPLVEVFSVYVGACDSSADYPLALCGSILVRDARAENYVFVRNKDFPHKLSGGKFGNAVSLTWPSTDDGWVLEKDFLMHFKLENNHGRKVTVGTLQFPFRPLSFTPYDAPYDRRMCDFIHGENGYFIAVHYSIFKNGKKARIHLKWKECESLVYGSVFAEYRNQRYLSSYDKEFYRSIIFKRSARECLKVETESEVSLSKSNISAPSSCEKLTLCVNLLHRSFKPHCSIKSPTSGVRAIKRDIHFKVGCNSVIDLKSFLVEVNWF